MQALILPSYAEVEDMALNPADKTWIRGEIQGRGWRRIIVWAKEWGILALVGGAIIVAIVEWNHFTNDYSAFRQHTDDRLKTIETKLNIQAALQSSPSAALDELAKLDQKEFAGYLPVLRKVVEQPAAKINPDEKTIRVIALRLRQTSETTPDYWTTVAAIINYQSLINQMRGEAPDPSKVSKSCLEFFKISLFERTGFSQCNVTLDTNAFKDVTFRDSVVEYHGGQTYLENVEFINCTFKLNLASAPIILTQSGLLLALLDSADQKTIKISTHI